ncbi:hypothetical protein EV421DRAFT_575303 [Armillaria borealis]|uniref:BTB domain-containing protein n=1 Tax=Armillaria borealis TaxID=47425 RepID=A0AA39ICP3_9AGAR|nr:hypothetical protein EV421DRAFT_575303 [Armillaria borealis]
MSSGPAPISQRTVRMVHSDRWSSDPFQVQSSFAVISWWRDREQFQSAICGLGWYFTGTLVFVEFTSRTKTGIPSKSRYCEGSLSVHPGAIGNMPFGELRIIAECCGKEAFSCSLKLPVESPEITLGTFIERKSYGEISFDVTVTLIIPREPVVQIPTEPEIMEVITTSLGGEFPIDKKFVLFTRRSKQGGVSAPRAIFTTSKILKGRSKFFDKYMIEDDIADIDADNSDFEADFEYPFEDDSDLESDVDPDDEVDVDAQEEENCAATGGYTSDASEMVVDTVSVASTFAISPVSERLPSDSDGELEMSSKSLSNQAVLRAQSVHQEDDTDQGGSRARRPRRLGSVFFIKGIAYQTFRALIAWVYTGKIAFKPLKSAGSQVQSDDHACSPKSMYRLASQAGLQDVKELAFNNLRSQLSQENIIREVFSTFSRDYPEVLEMELTVLRGLFGLPRVRVEWESMIDVVFDGGVPHGLSVIKRVTRIVNSLNLGKHGR